MRAQGKVGGSRLAALLVWVGLLLGYQWYAWRQDLSTLEAVQHLIDFMSSGLAGPLIYALRPLILFPASLLTLAAGFVFGPVLGLLFTVLGSNVSASLAYLAGRYFGRGFQNTGRMGDTLEGYAERLHRNSFESVLIMRLIFVPFDAVNYAAGLLHVRYRPFILATILGSLPGTTSFVLFGASMQGSFTDGTPDLNLWILLALVPTAPGSLHPLHRLQRLDGATGPRHGTAPDLVNILSAIRSIVGTPNPPTKNL